jgi:serine/threonine protein kinase/Tol biopolymer transport system component
MNSERWQRVKELLEGALTREPHERARFLDEQCADDKETRQEVETLLIADEQAGNFGETPAIEVMAEIIANEPADLLLEKSLAHYQIIDRLGAGGMGEVYLAEDTKLGRKVAIKVLPHSLTTDEQSKHRFIQEAKTASSLNHPNIITIYEISSDIGHDFIAMEYVEGETVRGMLSGARIKTSRAADLIAQTASALAAAHEAGIIHRDIKPENLMVTRASQVKVLDFGLAKLVEAQRPSLVTSDADADTYILSKKNVRTMPGTVLGTVSYMSPEQAEGLPVDRRSDIFSLGVVLYEILGGKRPFEGKSAIDTLHAIINDQPPSIVELNPSLPFEVTEVLGKAMAKDRAERYQHAGDFELDLKRFKRALETNSLASSRMLAGQKIPLRRSRWIPIWALLALLILAGISFAAWRIGQARKQPTAKSSLESVRLFPVTVDAGFEGEPSFAPDGQTIAYVSDRTGNFDIYLKQISGGPDINLTNHPADDMQPAVSPDGKQIAFVSSRSGKSDCLCFFIYGTDQPLMGGSIWVMPALGGSPRRIVESGTFPSWSPDGNSIIFTKGPWYGQKVYKVPATGGEPQEINIKLKGGAPFIAYPSYSPDGRWITFEAANNVFVVNANGGEPVAIVEGKHPKWSGNTESLIYCSVEAGKNYTLWQIPFSTNEGKSSGSPEPLTVGRGRDTQAALSRDGKSIAFSALDVSFNLEALPFDPESGQAKDRSQPITSGSDLIYFHSSSPDGAASVFESHRGATSFIWRVDHGSPPVQLTADPNYTDSFPRWSPDGRFIAFNRIRANDVNATEDLWLMAADGANPQRLIEKAGYAEWMPDGNALTYVSLSEGQLYVYDFRTKSSRKLTNERGIFGSGAPSSDGRWITFMSIASGNVDIRAVPIEGGQSRTVVASEQQDFHPKFSPSGKWVYFLLDHLNLYRVPGPAQNWREAKPEKVTHFPESGLFLEDPRISPKGNALIYARRRTTGDIWVMSLNK